MKSLSPTCPDDSRNHRPLLSALGATVLRALLWPSRVMEARRTMAQLAGMSDYELRDIGLARQALVDPTPRPLDEDPPPHLAGTRAARAHAAHARRLPG